MQRLQKGAKGEEVVKLQEMLRQAGYFNHPTNTGYFGDITDSALRAYQKDRGLKVDGIYGDRTQLALNYEKEWELIKNNPNITAREKEIMNPANGDVRIQTPYSQTDNPEDYAKIRLSAEERLKPMYESLYKTTEEQYAPFYNQKQQYEAGGLQNNIYDTETDYSNALKGSQTSQQEDTKTLQDKIGQSGSWASTSRMERERSLQNKYSQANTDLYNKAASSILANQNKLGYLYGDEKVNPFSLVKPNTGDYTTNNTTYKPFKVAGTRQAEKVANLTKITNNNINSINKKTLGSIIKFLFKINRILNRNSILKVFRLLLLYNKTKIY